MAVGTTRTSEDVNKTTGSVEQMSQTIAGVARGAQEQAKAIGRASEVMAQISSAIRQVTANAQSGASGADEAAEAAWLGAKTVEATIASMATIKQKADLSA